MSGSRHKKNNIDTNLKEVKAVHEHLKEEMLAKMETNQEKIDDNQEKMEARMDTNNVKFEVLREG
jgi:hypothetical protein